MFMGFPLMGFRGGAKDQRFQAMHAGIPEQDTSDCNESCGAVRGLM